MPVASSDGWGSYSVAIQDAPVTSSVQVEDCHLEELVEYFKDLAASWRGWEGEKKFGSLEQQLQLSCAFDILGHVVLKVTIRPQHGFEDAWIAIGTLRVNSGQLDEIANRASRFFSP